MTVQSSLWEEDVAAPSLLDFLNLQQRDPNTWQRLTCAHHAALFSAAIDYIAQMEKALTQARTLIAEVVEPIDCTCIVPNGQDWYAVDLPAHIVDAMRKEIGHVDT